MKFQFSIAIAIASWCLLSCGCDRKPVATKDFASATNVTIRFGKTLREEGLRWVPTKNEGELKPTTARGFDCQSVRLDKRKEGFLYFIIDPAFKKGGAAANVRIEIEYFDAMKGTFDVEYDGPSGAYTKTSHVVSQQRTLEWERAEFQLRRARFDNLQNNNADFRIRARLPELIIRRVAVYRDDSEVTGPYAKARELSVVLGETSEEKGLRQIEQRNDGADHSATIAGVACRQLNPHRNFGFFYFAVDPSFKDTNHIDANIEVEFFDGTNGVIELHYDGWSASNTGNKGAYNGSRNRYAMRNTRQWRTVTFPVTDARFENRQNGGADFRVHASAPELAIRRVVLKRK